MLFFEATKLALESTILHSQTQWELWQEKQNWAFWIHVRLCDLRDSFKAVNIIFSFDVFQKCFYLRTYLFKVVQFSEFSKQSEAIYWSYILVNN